MPKSKPVDTYIAKAPPLARAMMKQLRATIKSAAPKAEEKLSYGMPYYGYHGRLAYFAAFRDHVSYFVMSSRRIEAKFGKSMKLYRTGRATLQFRLGLKVPVGLIKKLVIAKAKENEAKARTKGRT